MDDYPNIPPHIAEWMQTPDGWRTVTKIVFDAFNDAFNDVTTAEVREMVEAAYRRRGQVPHATLTVTDPAPRYTGELGRPSAGPGDGG